MLSELTLPAEQSASGLFFMILCFQVQRNLLRAQLFNQCRDALGNIFDQTPCFAAGGNARFSYLVPRT
jgi:hypothetical protein